jgi:hypothetical protein
MLLGVGVSKTKNPAYTMTIWKVFCSSGFAF